MLPVGRAEIDNDGKQIHAIGFTKEQAEHLPEFNESLKIDRDYEERVKGVYRPRPVEAPERPLEAHRPLEASRQVVYPEQRATSAQQAPVQHQQQPPVQPVQQHPVQSVPPSSVQTGVPYPPTQVPPTPPMPTPPVQQVQPVQPMPTTHQDPLVAPAMQQAPPVPVQSVQQAPPAQVSPAHVPSAPPAQGYPPVPQQMPVASQQSYHDPNDAHYQQDPYLYGMNQKSHSVLQRYEDRLLAKKRQERQYR